MLKHMFVATKRLSQQKLYLWQLPPMIVYSLIQWHHVCTVFIKKQFITSGLQFSVAPSFCTLMFQLFATVLCYGLHWGRQLEESVAWSKSTHSQKPELSTIKCGHQMDGWPLCARLCACPEICLESTVQPLQRSFRWDQGPPCEYACKNIIYTHIKDPVVHVRIWWTMETTREPRMH